MKTWIEIFTKAGVNYSLLTQQSYLIARFSKGESYCKACDKYLPSSEVDSHMANHIVEIDEYFNRKKEEAKINRLEGRKKAQEEKANLPKVSDSKYYETVCSVCQQGIERTGKRGRPPTKHAWCK